MSWLLDREVRRELPEDWGGIVPTNVFVEEAKSIVDKARDRGLTLRIMGGLAILIHSGNMVEFAGKLGRTGTGVVKGQEYSDIDLMSYRKQRRGVTDFFREIGYVKRRATLSSAASERQIYYHPKGWFYVDVFYDQLLVANHPLDFRRRLELDYPTISVTDLLLEKIQIWEAFGKKDLKDCLILLRCHSVGDKDAKETINASYIAGLLAKDWGFWYTATTNLKRIKTFLTRIEALGEEVEIDPTSLKGEDIDDITAKIDYILGKVDEKPKSLKWKMRSKVGTKKRWYNPVERPDTVAGFGIWEAILK